jgi:hypothetical protein
MMMKTMTMKIMMKVIPVVAVRMPTMKTKMKMKRITTMRIMMRVITDDGLTHRKITKTGNMAGVAVTALPAGDLEECRGMK